MHRLLSVADYKCVCLELLLSHFYSLVSNNAYLVFLCLHFVYNSSTFINNNGQNVPVFGALYVPVVLQGHNLFDRNKGGAFLVSRKVFRYYHLLFHYNLIYQPVSRCHS